MKCCLLLFITGILILFISCAANNDIPANADTTSNDVITKNSIPTETSVPEDNTTKFEGTTETEITIEPITMTTEETNPSTEEDTSAYSETAEETKEKMPVESKLYTVEEIRAIFEKERGSFEAIKDLFLARRYRLYIAKRYADPDNPDPNNAVLVFNTWEYDKNQKLIYHPIAELESYEKIIDFLLQYKISSIQGSNMSEMDDNRIKITIKYAEPRMYQYIIYSAKDRYSNPENDETDGIKLDENWYYQLFLGI